LTVHISGRIPASIAIPYLEIVRHNLRVLIYNHVGNFQCTKECIPNVTIQAAVVSAHYMIKDLKKYYTFVFVIFFCNIK